MSGFDPVFHAADLGIQPPPSLPWWDVYPLLNGRGYPDTVNPSGIMNDSMSFNGTITSNKVAQKINAIVTCTHPDRRSF